MRMSRCDLFLHKGVEGRILFRQDNAEAGDALIGERRGVRSDPLLLPRLFISRSHGSQSGEQWFPDPHQSYESES
jgi:hypothetical protein